ncbi:CD3324 family protein [Desulfosporosinus nitroreducens]|uniref:CD3324 family protein n=1 Tax=Desulfosporosinus nitroreducens TaxID=2018668 RepID=A0ABT8QY57_9FIRM|nr:CD3324 family protein [Desulfosporosinus nitroreducens]MCO1604705.1 CD3324 family protein [Desulfosporosinus nitroreducens]MDO0825555.1 CD3324 family protein [Desulfosporosinus nitroreducens]
MSYKKANHIFPAELLEIVQEYVDGECVYIPRKPSNKKEWGTETTIRDELEIRNWQIYQDYQSGCDLEHLSQKYYLSLKSIQRVILQGKKK